MQIQSTAEVKAPASRPIPEPRRLAEAAVSGAVAVRIKPYRVAEIAALLDVHQATIYRDIECGRLRAHRVGSGKGALRIFPAAYDTYLALLEVRAVALAEVA
jgi:excisionase family DNA binding protein